ncbi:MAG: hypothetical protein B7Y90_00340 [Alphaproteobacteria bacterium 32-64-14]|nr:MAG: hypothetical protein B7Y90_00340 [Alphaproteobacteria bacterium 32-64-14]
MTAKSTLWAVAVFTVFAFATLIVFFWIRDGSLQGAGVSMDNLLGRAGDSVVETTTDIVQNTGAAIDKATDGDNAT